MVNTHETVALPATGLDNSHDARLLLFYWPTDGWVRGMVARCSRAAGHSPIGAGRCCG